MIPFGGYSPRPGLQIMLSYAVPRMRPKFQLKPELTCVTEEFRGEYNEWLRQWFGEEPFMVLVQYADGQRMVMHPDTWGHFFRPHFPIPPKGWDMS